MCFSRLFLTLKQHVIHFVGNVLFYIYLLLINLSLESRHEDVQLLLLMSQFTPRGPQLCF